jgi:hypothetical protein
MTSLTAWMMCRLFEKAGLPKGVVNMVFGRGASAERSALQCWLALHSTQLERTRTRTPTYDAQDRRLARRW